MLLFVSWSESFRDLMFIVLNDLALTSYTGCKLKRTKMYCENDTLKGQWSSMFVHDLLGYELLDMMISQLNWCYLWFILCLYVYSHICHLSSRSIFTSLLWALRIYLLTRENDGKLVLSFNKKQLFISIGGSLIMRLNMDFHDTWQSAIVIMCLTCPLWWNYV